MNDIVTMMKAADFAARKHANQKRKGEVAEPYLNHLIEVATLVAEATERESGTARLEEAVAACRAALEEFTRERAPLQWAMTQNNHTKCLAVLDERGTA